MTHLELVLPGPSQRGEHWSPPGQYRHLSHQIRILRLHSARCSAFSCASVFHPLSDVTLSSLSTKSFCQRSC